MTMELTDREEEMCELLKNAARNAHANSADKGFWGEGTKTPLGYAAKIALMHSELSELLEAVRKDPAAPCAKVPELTVEEEEVADVFIRLLDYCGARGIDLGRAALKKHKYNTGRPPMHGKTC